MDDVDDDEGDPVPPGVVLVAPKLVVLVVLVGGCTGGLRDWADGILVLQECKECWVLQNSHGRIRD